VGGGQREREREKERSKSNLREVDRKGREDSHRTVCSEGWHDM
jgi:hypothetical protein